MASILLAGCGYLGRRMLARLRRQGFEINALVASEGSAALLENKVDRVIQLDLDQAAWAAPTLPDADQVYYFIPPPSNGVRDTRITNFLEMLSRSNRPQRILLISTSGVYGDCDGEWVDESRPAAPVAERAKRRFDAEQQLTTWCLKREVEHVILRVAGIYGPQRLPLARLEKRVPMVSESEAPWTNRIHVDDLATVCEAVMENAPSGEIFNVSDGHPGNMTDYFNRVADAAGLPRPPQISLTEAQAQLSPGMLSYLRESRRLDTSKLRAVEGVTFRYPTLDQGLKASLP